MNDNQGDVQKNKSTNALEAHKTDKCAYGMCASGGRRIHLAYKDQWFYWDAFSICIRKAFFPEPAKRFKIL